VNFIEVADALLNAIDTSKYHLTPHVTMMVLLPEHHFLVGYGLRTQSNYSIRRLVSYCIDTLTNTDKNRLSFTLTIRRITNNLLLICKLIHT
jgi:hypothetical protein